MYLGRGAGEGHALWSVWCQAVDISSRDLIDTATQHSHCGYYESAQVCQVCSMGPWSITEFSVNTSKDHKRMSLKSVCVIL